MRVTSKGQVTIPQAIREEAGLMPNTEVEFSVEDGDVLIRKVTQPTRATRGTRAVAQLRHARPHVSMTTDELMALTRSDT